MGTKSRQIATFADIRDNYDVTVNDTYEDKCVTLNDVRNAGLVAVNQGQGQFTSSEVLYESSEPATNYGTKQLVRYNDIVRKLQNVPFTISKSLQTFDFTFNLDLTGDIKDIPADLIFHFDITLYPTYFYTNNIRDWPQYGSLDSVNIDSPDYGQSTYSKTICVADGDPAYQFYSLRNYFGIKYSGYLNTWEWEGQNYACMNWGAIKVHPYITNSEIGPNRWCFVGSEYRAVMTMQD